MSAIGSKAALLAGVEAVTAESGGMMEVAVVRPSDVPVLLGEALAGSEDAAMLLRLYGDTSARIDKAAGAGTPMLCVSCPRALQKGYSVAAALPRRDNPHHAVAVAVCPRCGPDRAAIEAKAMQGFAKIWTGLRPIQLTHHDGGRA